MKNQLFLISILILGISLGLTGHLLYKTSKENKLLHDKNNLLQRELSINIEKSKEVSPYFHYSEFEDQLIDIIKNTDKYKTDQKYIETHAPNDDYLKFGDGGFTTDGTWYFGSLDYINLYKNTDSFIPKKGENLPLLEGNWQYILKIGTNQKIDKLVVDGISSRKEWNEAIYNLPENVVPTDKVKYYLNPDD